jgi:hypothetical protein
MNIYDFYNEIGWRKVKNNSIDAELFEDLRHVARKYVSQCRKKIIQHLPKKGVNILDFASGPIQYQEYLLYSKNFKKRHCVDFSKTAINSAKQKLGNKGKYYCRDFLKIRFKKNFFDCSISLHTVYHIKKNHQKKIVEKLIDITKKNKPIIIVYSNPNNFIAKIKKIFFKKRNKGKIYFYCHSLEWWSQFSTKVKIEMYPWRSFSAQHQKLLFPDNILGQIMFEFLLKLEKFFPNFFVKYFQYPIIVLKKK